MHPCIEDFLRHKGLKRAGRGKEHGTVGGSLLSGTEQKIRANFEHVDGASRLTEWPDRGATADADRSRHAVIFAWSNLGNRDVA